jgi:hypothetical protein
MSWLKVTDGTWMEPWVVAVGNETFGIYTRLASYCAQYLTDGNVPGQIVALITAGNETALEDLERYGMIERWESGGVRLPRYLKHNPTRAKVEAEREMRAERAKAGARKRWEHRA